MPVQGAAERIHRTVLAWPGVAAAPHRFGGTEYRIGRREIGHTHGDVLVDIPLPMRIRNEVIAAGLAQPHHVLPRSGWVSLSLRTPEDVDRAIDLLRQSFDAAMEQLQRHHSGEGES